MGDNTLCEFQKQCSNFLIREKCTYNCKNYIHLYKHERRKAIDNYKVKKADKVVKKPKIEEKKVELNWDDILGG